MSIIITGAHLGAALGTNVICKTLLIPYQILIIENLKRSEINPSGKTRVLPHSTITTKRKVELLFIELLHMMGRINLLEKSNWQQFRLRLGQINFIIKSQIQLVQLTTNLILDEFHMLRELRYIGCIRCRGGDVRRGHYGCNESNKLHGRICWVVRFQEERLLNYDKHEPNEEKNQIMMDHWRFSFTFFHQTSKKRSWIPPLVWCMRS